MRQRSRLVVITLAMAISIPLLFARNRPTVTVSHAPSVTGIVSSVQGSLITILDGSVTIDATGARIVSGRDDAPLSSVTTGVRIHAVLQSIDPVAGTGALRAQIIVIDNPPDGNLTGAVQSIDLAANRFSLLGESILVTSGTVFIGSHAHPEGLKLSDLHVGDPVSVDVDAAVASLSAIRVLVLHMTPRPGAHLTGTVKSVGAEQWVITDPRGNDVTIRVTADTKIGGNPNVGDRVEVFGHIDSSNQFVATSIVKIIVIPRPVVFRGFVKTIGSDAWTVVDPSGKEISLEITSETKIVGSPVVGDLVEVTAHVEASGAHVAISILKAIPPRPVIIMIASVKTIGDHEWMFTDANGQAVVVRITSESRIDRTIVVGDRVQVTATRDDAGALTALTITRYQEPPPPSQWVKFEGVVRSIEGDVWTIDATKVLVSPRTLFIGHPKVGDRVRVIGIKAADDTVMAISLEKIV